MKRRYARLSSEVIAALLARAARNMRDPEYQRRQREYLRQMYEVDVLAEERGDYREVFDLREMERETICKALKVATSKAEVARLLGIDRSTLHRSMKRHSIEMSDYGKPDSQPPRPRKKGRLRGATGSATARIA